MQKALFIKLALIVGLIVLLMIPIALIEGVVHDRTGYRHQALVRRWIRRACE